MSTASTTTAVAVGAMTVEFCIKQNKSAAYVWRPPMQLLLLDAEKYPEVASRILDKFSAELPLEQYVVSATFKPRKGLARLLEWKDSKIKLKFHDRFRRHTVCVTARAKDLVPGKTALLPNALPGFSCQLGIGLERDLDSLQVAIDKRHLRANAWKQYISVYYTMEQGKFWTDAREAPQRQAIACAYRGCHAPIKGVPTACACGQRHYCNSEHAQIDWVQGNPSGMSAPV